jgi:spore maturation protein SpmB
VKSILQALETAATWAVPLFIVAVPWLGLRRKVRVYEAFTEGAKEGFQVAVRIIPYLVAILGAVGALRGSGALDALANHVGPYTEKIGLPAVALPMLLIRPLSGSAAQGLVAGVLADPRYGPDSYAGHLVSVMAGSTETTFYVLAVYCGAVGINRYRQALPAALMADVVGFIASIAVCWAIFR